MDPIENKARELYFQLKEASADRPRWGNSVGELQKSNEAWMSRHKPVWDEIRAASSELQVELLRLAPEYLREAGFENLSFLNTIFEVTRTFIQKLPKPLPSSLIEQLLGEMSRGSLYSFPSDDLLRAIDPAQVTEAMRRPLEKLLHLNAPSRTGKIDKHVAETRELIKNLLPAENATALPEGMGPWTATVERGLNSLPDEVLRSGYRALLEHCKGLKQTIPGRKWNTEARELLSAIGDDAASRLRSWLALGPTPGQPPEAISPIEDSETQKGLVWAAALEASPEVARAIGDFGLACLRKIPMIGAVSPKVGFACINALGEMKDVEAIAQLTRLRAKVRYVVAAKLIAKSLAKAAERMKMGVEHIEDLGVDDFGLSMEGCREIQIGDAAATLQLNPDGSVGVAWRNADNKLVKSAPAHVKKAFPAEVKEVATTAKQIEQAWSAQRARMDAAMASPSGMPLEHWQKYYIEHPLLGQIGRRLIWNFRDGSDESAGLWREGHAENAKGEPLTLTKEAMVRLWHPLSASDEQSSAWQKRIGSLEIAQPVKQAFRETYRYDVEQGDKSYHSNRFAGRVLRQHQLASLCRERGWIYKLMGAHFDGFNVPTKRLNAWDIDAHFFVDLPSDVEESLRDSAMAEKSGSGIGLYVISDQVRFYRSRQEVTLDEVPALAFSELMRDVDLFTSAASIGRDETWKDRGDRGSATLRDWGMRDLREWNKSQEDCAELFRSFLPKLALGDRVKVERGVAIVTGQLGTYRILLPDSHVYRPSTRGVTTLEIPLELLEATDVSHLGLPPDMNHRMVAAFQKTIILASDFKITHPDLVRQLSDE